MKDDLYKNAVRIWGEDLQVLITIEEMAELTTALMHRIRGRKSDIITELADVEIMIEQLKYIFDDGTFQKEKEKKLDRLASIIEEELKKENKKQDVPNLQVDTKLYVSDDEWEHKFKRHFSHFGKTGAVYCFRDGNSSFTTVDNKTSLWSNWELAEENEG